MSGFSKTLNIIIADDSKEFLEGLQYMLSENEDYSIVDVASNGEQLLNSDNLTITDLVITDIEMPKINGIEVAKKINYRYPNIYMIALTMYLDQVYLTEIVEAGFKGFIYKPDIAVNLYDTITRVLNNEYVFPEKLKFNK